MSNYVRQSSFSNGDIIDAAFFNAEYDQLESAFTANTGHSHDGSTGEGGFVPLISNEAGSTQVSVDETDPDNHKIVFKIDGNIIREISEENGDNQADTEFITHTPDGGSEVFLNTYLDGLEVAVGDAADDAASAAEDAQRAENAAMVVGAPALVADAGTYTIDDDAEVADVIFEGDGTLNLPSALVKGRRFTIRLHTIATSKVVTISNPSFTIIGSKKTLTAGEDLCLLPSDLVVLEAVSTTQLEII